MRMRQNPQWLLVNQGGAGGGVGRLFPFLKLAGRRKKRRNYETMKIEKIGQGIDRWVMQSKRIKILEGEEVPMRCAVKQRRPDAGTREWSWAKELHNPWCCLSVSFGCSDAEVSEATGEAAKELRPNAQHDTTKDRNEWMARQVGVEVGKKGRRRRRKGKGRDFSTSSESGNTGKPLAERDPGNDDRPQGWVGFGSIRR